MSTYTTPTSRARNAAEAQPKRMESPDGSRWAIGRNVKRAEAGRRYSIVESWTLKTRDAAGKAVVVRGGATADEASAFCKG